MALPATAPGRAAADHGTPSHDATPVRVMVVDDSAVVRGLVSRWVSEIPGMTVVARASNGRLAVDEVAKSDPEIVVLDIEMPVMDGLTALPQLLKVKPSLRVIMASTLTQRNAEISFRAMAMGAVDYIPKPERNSGISTSDSFRQDLISKISGLGARLRGGGGSKRSSVGAGSSTTALKRTSEKPTLKAPKKEQRDHEPSRKTTSIFPTKNFVLRPYSNVKPRVIAFGSSTGGPQALLAVIKSVAPTLKGFPVLLTQHMPKTFTPILARHIGEAAQLPTREAEDGEALEAGHIYVAPGGVHMKVVMDDKVQRICLYDGPKVNFCKPAVDPLFESLAAVYGPAVLAVVLTGMGQDGAMGAEKVAQAGGSVIAQDEATSIVWGMPGATAAIGACSAVLPLDKIGPEIKRFIGS